MSTDTKHRGVVLRKEQHQGISSLTTELDEDEATLLKKGGTSENTPQSTAAQSYASDDLHMNAENTPRQMDGQKYLT